MANVKSNTSNISRRGYFYRFWYISLKCHQVINKVMLLQMLSGKISSESCAHECLMSFLKQAFCCCCCVAVLLFLSSFFFVFLLFKFENCRALCIRITVWKTLKGFRCNEYLLVFNFTGIFIHKPKHVETTKKTMQCSVHGKTIQPFAIHMT